MSGKLTTEDIEFLSGLVTAEVTRVVDAKLEEFRQAVTQTFVNLALSQLQMFGIEVKQSANGQGPDA